MLKSNCILKFIINKYQQYKRKEKVMIKNENLDETHD